MLSFDWSKLFLVIYLILISNLIFTKVLKAPDVTAQMKLSDSANTSPSMNSVKMRKRPSKTSLPHVVNSSRSSLHFPIISGLVDKQNLEIGKVYFLRNVNMKTIH